VDEVPPGPFSQEAGHGRLGQRADGHPVEAQRRPCLPQAERVAASADAQRHQDPDRRILQTTNHERQHPRRGHIQPLHVVDRDDHRIGSGHRAQGSQRGHRHRPLVRWGTLDFRSQECGVQRALLRRRQIRQLEVEEVTKRRVGQAGLRFRCAASEHPEASCPREGHGRVPQRRLADPGGSLKDQGRGPPSRRVEEILRLGELGIPAEDPVNRLCHPTPPTASAPILWASGQPDQSHYPAIPGRGRGGSLACLHRLERGRQERITSPLTVDGPAAWGSAAPGRRPWWLAPWVGGRCAGPAGTRCAGWGGADHLGELGLDEGLVDGLGGLADAVIHLRGRECVASEPGASERW
jgi:hypothetical protein